MVCVVRFMAGCSVVVRGGLVDQFVGSGQGTHGSLDLDYGFGSRWSAGVSLRYVGDLSLFIFNVANEAYAAWATAAGGQSVMANIGAPRTASAQWRCRF